MTITVITGTPGAGKTLHAIEKLLLPLVGTFVPQEIDGVTTLHPRTIYTNIKGLLIDHELIDGGDNKGLADWHTWAKPGAVICFDEVQKIWKPRPNGSKVPEEVEALETHRHMGVDFIIITQNVMLVDRNIQALTSRHLHVRRMANLRLAIVYEWDHCSKSLMYSKALTKSPWRYNKDIFKLYHSSDLHTKQPRSMPGVVWFLLVAIIGFMVLGPYMYKRMKERFDPPALHQKATPGSNPGVGLAGPVSAASAPLAAASVPVPGISVPGVPVEAIAGCARYKDTCRCYDSHAQLLDKPKDFCSDKTGPGLMDSPISDYLDRVAPYKAETMPSQDIDLLGWVHRYDVRPASLREATEYRSLHEIR